MFTSFEKDRPYIWSKFHNPQLDETTGLPWQELKKGATAFYDKKDELPRPVLKARAFEYLCQNMRIDVNPQDFFPTFACWNRDDRPLSGLVWKFLADVHGSLTQRRLWDDINGSGAGNQWVDFDHSVPDWYYILPLGFPGMKAKAQEYKQALESRQGGTLTAEQAAYYDGIDITYQAMLDMMGRFVDYARAHADGNPRLLAVADCIQALREHEPRDTYQLMQFIYLYFIFSEHIDRYQVRSLGNLDNMFLPYFERDIANGTYTEQEIRVLWDYFLMQWGAIDNYWGHPFYLGGTHADGSSRINKLSFLILEEFDKLSIPTPKIQLKIAKNTPDEFVNAALNMIRKGNNSLVFISEEQVLNTMVAHGHTPEDARTADIRGCYEVSAAGYHSENGTGGGHVNFLKPFEWIFNDGIDSRLKRKFCPCVPALDSLKTFDDFYRAYVEILRWITESEMAVANDFEQYIAVINPSNVFSASIRTSLENARDGFFNGCYFNKSTLLATGVASAVDALMAVREYVYDKREITLQDFSDCLKNNWQGYEHLHGKIMRDKNKYGNGIPEVDRYAGYIANYYGSIINDRPNARGGVWAASGHCAKQYFVLGEKTMATPDGRHDGEEMSKNLSPVQGMDRKGLTALLRSVSAIDPAALPGDFPLDVMLHPATVQGDDGLAVWRSLLRFYLEHGLAIHFNIFDAETLKAAQREPDKYQGLQIRVCGWNVRFTTMAPVEQDMFIRRAENLME